MAPTTSMQVPTGVILPWGGTVNNVPDGYLPCIGEAVTINDYPNLYAVIGTNFGANPPSGSFYLPDMRGRFLRGVDDKADRDPDVATRTDSVNPALIYSGTGSIQGDAIQTHTHSYNSFPYDDGHIASGTYWQNGSIESGPPSPPANVSTETRPLNIYVFFIIAT